MIKQLLVLLSMLPAVWTMGQEASSDTTFLTLEECVELAVENNLNIQRSRLNLQSSQINLTESKWALAPSLNGNASYGFQWGRNIDRATNQFVTQRIANSSSSVSGQITLFNAGRLRNDIRQNVAEVKASEYDVQKALNDVQIDVISFFINVLFNRELLDNAQSQLASSRQQLARTEILVASGALPRANELELISQVATNEVNLVNAQNNYSISLLTLKQALLLPASNKIGIKEPDLGVEPVVVDMSLNEIYRLSEESLPEIKSADARIERSEWAVQAARAARMPTLALTAGLATNYSDAFPGTFVEDPNASETLVPTGTLFTAGGDAVFTPFTPGEFTGTTFGEQYADNLGQSVFLTLSIPIFNRFSLQSSVQRSEVALDQSQLNALEQRNLLRQTIENAYYDAMAAEKTYQASEKQVAALEETFRMVQSQFNLGAANFTDFQIASNNLFQAKSDLARFKFDYLFKQKLLDFYQGKPLF